MSTASWKTFHSEDSWLPLYLPLTIWLGGLLYCHQVGKPFHKWELLHNVHNFGGILLALVSMYFNDDNIFNERIPILWTFGYFCVDLLDCLYRRDVPFILHAFFCLVLGVGCYTSPIFRVLRINSKALLCELSSPFLHLAKQTRAPHHFALFALVFLACRIIWLPVFLSELRHYDLTWFDFRLYFLLAFYGLNCFWFYKIVRILLKGSSRGNATKKD